MPIPLIGGPANSLTVKARQKLKTPEQCDAFLQELNEKFEQHADSTLTFEDIDISQNPIPFEQFTNFFATLQATGCNVQRLRLFGCPTLNDDAVTVLAGWLATVAPEAVPLEMHLSDCAITTEGFTILMEAIEQNESFPKTTPHGSTSPMYVRMENNYISEEAIQERIACGTLTTFTKGWQGGGQLTNPAAKVKLLVRGPGQFQQKQGEPPAPEDAAAPKQVIDWNADWQAQQQAKGKGKMGKGMQQQQVSQPWQQQAQAQAAWMQPRPAWPQQNGAKGGQMALGAAQGARAVPAQQAWAGAPAQQQQPWGKGARPAAVQQQAWGGAPQQQAWGKGGAAKGAVAGDRSRTPMPVKPAQPPVVKRLPAALPAPWEEHFSDEYGIPYFWNAKSGEAVWERPAK